MKQQNKNIPIGTDTALVKMNEGYTDVRMMAHNSNMQYFKVYDIDIKAWKIWTRFLLDKGKLSQSDILNLLKLEEDFNVW